MFRVKQSCIDTLGEHVIFIHKDAVESGHLGFGRWIVCVLSKRNLSTVQRAK